MDSPPPTSTRNSRQSGFTLVEILIAASLTLILVFGVLSAYLFLGRNFTRLTGTQQQDVKARRALRQFTQDVGTANTFTTTTASSLVFTAPITVPACATTAGSPTVTCTSTAALAAGMTIWSVAPITLKNCATTNGNATVTCANTAGLFPGVVIAGPGLPTTGLPTLPVTVSSITNGTTFVLSTKASSTNSGVSLYANVKDIPDSTTISSITNGTTFVLSANAKATTSGLTFYTTTTITYTYNSVGGTLTRTIGGAPATTLLTDIDATVTSPTNGFAYFDQFGNAITATTTVKAVEFAFSTAVGTSKIGTKSSYRIVSPRVVVRNSAPQ